MTTVVVTPAGAAHADVMAAIHSEAFAEGWAPAAFASLLAMPGAAAMLAIAGDGEPVGLIVYRHAGEEAEILTIAVRPAARRSGVGRALFAATCADLPSSIVQMFIEVAESNEPARALYRALGFETVGRRAGYYATCTGPEDALVMRRLLP